MSYIQPNSIIQLFKGINLDNRYMHTIYFASVSAQNTWFSSKVYKSFTAQSYVRYTAEQVKIKCDATEIMDCTYLRFMNDRTADMWYYAFINSVEYLNENTALVTFEIDVMQTWFIQKGSVRPCLVRREHVSDDTFGLNLEAEPIGSDCYDADEILNGTAHIFENDFSSYSVVGQTTGTASVIDHNIQGLFTGCNYYYHEADDASDCNDIYSRLQTMLGSWSEQTREEDIIDLFTVPTFCADVNIGTDNSNGAITIPSTYDNYTPKNKKLFMYPYSYLLLTTHAGDTATYRWEYFDGTTGAACNFELEGTLIGGGEIRCYPQAYNGQVNNVDCGVVINNFPKNPALYDAYQAWMAAGGSTRLDNDRLVNSFKGVGAILPSLGGTISALRGNTSSSSSTTTSTRSSGDKQRTSTVSSQTISDRPMQWGQNMGLVGSIASGIGSVIEARNNMQYTFNDAMYQPNIVVGKPTSCLPVAARDLGTYFFHVHVRDDEAKRLDDFFSCYGYAVNKVKAPNLTGRSYWNFVMTENAVIAGNMPASSKEAIGRIFDSGITFWHNGDNVGNYAIATSSGSIDNPIVS